MEGTTAVVVVRQRGGTEVQRRLACGGALACMCALVGTLLLAAPPGQDDAEGAGGGAGRRRDLMRTELMLRSANLVVKDLAGEWDQVNFNREPFDFCGKAHMKTRQVKTCAEYFLSSMRDKLGDDQKGTGTDGVKLFAFPKLKAYSKCMVAPTQYMIKACIREVTRAMTPDELVHQTRTGSTGNDPELVRVAVHAIETSQPDSPLEGLNGGINGKLAEMASKKYLARVDMVGAASQVTTEAVPEEEYGGYVPEPGCEDLGIGGCDAPQQGGIKPNVKEWALEMQDTMKPPPEP